MSREIGREIGRMLGFIVPPCCLIDPEASTPTTDSPHEPETEIV